MGSRYGRRTGHLIRDAVADILRTDVNDPTLALVTITHADVTDDTRYATIHYAPVDPGLITPVRDGARPVAPPDEEAVAAALERATGRIRGRLGQRLRTRNTPELRWVVDATAGASAALEAVLQRVELDDRGRPPVPDELGDAYRGDPDQVP